MPCGLECGELLDRGTCDIGSGAAGGFFLQQKICLIIFHLLDKPEVATRFPNFNFPDVQFRLSRLLTTKGYGYFMVWCLVEFSQDAMDTHNTPLNTKKQAKHLYYKNK